MSAQRKRTIHVRDYGWSGGEHNSVTYDATIKIAQTTEKPDIVLHLRLFEIVDLVNTLRSTAKKIKSEVDSELKMIGEETP